LHLHISFFKEINDIAKDPATGLDCQMAHIG